MIRKRIKIEAEKSSTSLSTTRLCLPQHNLSLPCTKSTRMKTVSCTSHTLARARSDNRATCWKTMSLISWFFKISVADVFTVSGQPLVEVRPSLNHVMRHKCTHTHTQIHNYIYQHSNNVQKKSSEQEEGRTSRILKCVVANSALYRDQAHEFFEGIRQRLRLNME